MHKRLPYRKIDNHSWLIDTGLYRPRHTACYLLHSDGELALIDAGVTYSVSGILSTLEALGLSPNQVRYILPTHVHLDHAGGAGTLLAQCPNALLATHHRGLPHLIQPDKLQQGAQAVYGEEAFAQVFGSLESAPEQRTLALYDGDSLSLGNHELRFLDTPGHANHHGCYHYNASGQLFTGDSFGLSYPELVNENKPFLLATTTPVAFDPDAWLISLDKMMDTAPSQACLTHFGPLDNPQRWQALLRQSILEHARIALEEKQRCAIANQTPCIEKSLSKYLLDLWKAHTQNAADHLLTRILQDDIRLNAQGLSVWLARKARHSR